MPMRFSFRTITFTSALFLTALLLWQNLNIPLPSPTLPIIFYSNQSGTSLKYLYKTILRKTKNNLLAHVYDLSDSEILNLINKKHKNSCQVELYVDGHTTKRERKKFSHLPWNEKKGRSLMHEKILTTDSSCTYLGSTNFSTDSLSRHDNFVLGIFSTEIASYIKQHHDNRKARAPTPPKTFTIDSQTLTFYFLPENKKQALETFLRLIKQAKKRIDLAIFTFTHQTIAKELVNAHNRGVKIYLYLDYKSSKGASKKIVNELSQKKFPVYISSSSKLLHYKMMLIDDQQFIFGSSNWTNNAFNKNHDYLVWISTLKPSQTKQLSKIFKAIDKQSEQHPFLTANAFSN